MFNIAIRNNKETNLLEMKQVSDNCFAVLNEKNLVCDANSGLINLAGGRRDRHAVRFGPCAAND
jgi:hypothetical protein